MLVALGVSSSGSAACALAPNDVALILARAPAGVRRRRHPLPLAHTMIADMVSPTRAPALPGAVSRTMFMAASIAGPVLGGVLDRYVHWSLIFWINLRSAWSRCG